MKTERRVTGEDGPTTYGPTDAAPGPLARLRALLDCTSEGIFGVDLEGRCTFINKAGAALLGYAQADILGRFMHGLVHHTRQDGSPYPAEQCPIYGAFRTGRAYRGDEEVLWRRDGTAFSAECSSSPLYEGGMLRGAVITFNDITERKRAEAARVRLLDRVILVQEEERRRIAHELHDETEQALASLLIGLRALDEAADLDEVRRRAAELRRVAARSLTELQRLVVGLRPILLDELGLAAALRRLCDDVARASRLRVELHVGGLEGRRLPPAAETACYRIAQEALTNTSRHAGATAASVLVQPAGAALRMVVEDNGRGFDYEAVRRTAGQTGRLGLCGMQERAAALGGALTIETAEGRGTTLYLEIPLDREGAS